MKPDYSNSIINLMASIGEGLGLDRGGYPPLAQLPPARLHGRTVMLIVIDGLGADFLAGYPDSFLYRSQSSRITTVFPPTTASAVTSFATGAAPQQHGIPGWFTWFRELGSVAAVLPFRPRHGGVSYGDSGVMVDRLVGADPITSRIDEPSYVVSPSHIVDSRYSRFTAGTAQRIGYGSLDEFFLHLTRLSAMSPVCYVHAYWPELDALAHLHGVGSARVREHFLELDAAIERFVLSVRGCGAMIVVSADHGLIDTSPERTIHVADHTVLSESLMLPLCGEPRAAFCYVRQRCRRRFEDYVKNRLAHSCTLMSVADLIAQGYFGIGTPHPELEQRVGDYVLLMRDNWTISDRVLGESNFQPIGVHGGLSAEELLVPLVVIEP